jgi:hypothetical protein
MIIVVFLFIAVVLITGQALQIPPRNEHPCP